jgi:hypothetical protein
MPPIGVSAFALGSGESNQYRHKADHTPSWMTVRQNPATGGAWFTGAGGAVVFSGSMAVSVEMHHMGDPELQRDVVAMVEHVLSDRHGDWRVTIIGTQESDRWEMKIYGPNAFERSYTLEGSAGEHEPRVIASLVMRMVPGRS